MKTKTECHICQLVALMDVVRARPSKANVSRVGRKLAGIHKGGESEGWNRCQAHVESGYDVITAAEKRVSWVADVKRKRT